MLYPICQGADKKPQKAWGLGVVSRKAGMAVKGLESSAEESGFGGRSQHLGSSRIPALQAGWCPQD